LIPLLSTFQNFAIRLMTHERGRHWLPRGAAAPPPPARRSRALLTLRSASCLVVTPHAQTAAWVQLCALPSSRPHAHWQAAELLLDGRGSPRHGSRLLLRSTTVSSVSRSQLPVPVPPAAELPQRWAACPHQVLQGVLRVHLRWPRRPVLHGVPPRCAPLQLDGVVLLGRYPCELLCFLLPSGQEVLLGFRALHGSGALLRASRGLLLCLQ
jgi:hypothetical protein